MSKYVVLDIETGTLPNVVFPPFDPSDVAVGNIKNPVLIDEKINKEKGKYYGKLEAEAPLNAETAIILMINWYLPEKDEYHIHGIDPSIDITEKVLLEMFWSQMERWVTTQATIIGHNILNFDLKMLKRRSWINNVQIVAYDKWCVQDTMEMWGIDRDKEVKLQRKSLKALAQLLGVGDKSKEIGKSFEKFFYNEPDVAHEYAKNDIKLNWLVYEKLMPKQESALFLKNLQKIDDYLKNG